MDGSGRFRQSSTMDGEPCVATVAALIDDTGRAAMLTAPRERPRAAGGRAGRRSRPLAARRERALGQADGRWPARRRARGAPPLLPTGRARPRTASCCAAAWSAPSRRSRAASRRPRWRPRAASPARATSRALPRGDGPHPRPLRARVRPLTAPQALSSRVAKSPICVQAHHGVGN